MAQKIIFTQKKPNKYRNRKTMRGGILFDSKKEADRFTELQILERGGLISNLELQPKFAIVINGVKVCDYVGDFQYMRTGEKIIEDVKSEMTRKLPVYRLKFKLMKACHGITILET